MVELARDHRNGDTCIEVFGCTQINVGLMQIKYYYIDHSKYFDVIIVNTNIIISMFVYFYTINNMYNSRFSLLI